MTEQRLTDEQALAIEVKNADGLLPVQRAAAIARGHERWARAAILSANRVEPVAWQKMGHDGRAFEITKDADVAHMWEEQGRTVRPLYAAAPSTPQPAPELALSTPVAQSPEQSQQRAHNAGDAEGAPEERRATNPCHRTNVPCQSSSGGDSGACVLASAPGADSATPQPDTVQVPREPVGVVASDPGQWRGAFYASEWDGSVQGGWHPPVKGTTVMLFKPLPVGTTLFAAAQESKE